jgi:DNA helicase-2/ATP-dependent DNA helicase PcrA
VQLLELGDPLRPEQVGPAGQDLAQLHEGGAQFLQRRRTCTGGSAAPGGGVLPVQRVAGAPAHRPGPGGARCRPGRGAPARRRSAFGLAPDFTIIDRSDAEELLAQVRTRLDLHDSERRFPLARTCMAILSRTLNSAWPLPEVLAAHYPWCAEWQTDLDRLFSAYAQAKQAQRVLDYDDLLLYWHLALQEAPVARAMGARFDQVLVDEFQDTNRLQAGILHALKPDGQGVTVVGDDAQSIYAFRSAEVGNMLGFPQRFTPAASVLTLQRNYRSTQPLLAAANAVIAQASQRFAKTLWSDKASLHKPQLVLVHDEADQARWVADEVLRQREEGTPLTQQAVLFRTSHHSAALELELARRGIPFVKFGGLRFLEAAHIKDAVSLLRWTHNLRCRLAGFRVARLAAGIGPAAALQLLDAMDASADPATVLRQWMPPPRARLDWLALRDTCAPLMERDAPWPDCLAPAVTWLQSQLPRLYGDDARVRSVDLDQLCRLAAGYPSRERFLTELTLDPPEASSDEAGPPHRDEDYLILSTIHSAKGQEWHSVHVLNVVDGCMPADLATGSTAEIDEERRLLYVAMTRARERLHLLLPQRFHVTQQRARGSRHLYAARSRFIPSALDGLFDTVAPRPPSPDESVPADLQVDLAARARNAWRSAR